MFQSFEDAGATGATHPRLAALRERLAALGLGGFLVPRADEFQGEYVAPGAERLRWLTGFSGSAGLAIVLPARAAVFADGRYTIQLAAEIDAGLFEACHLIERPPVQWLAEALTGGEVIGYDPWLLTVDQAARFEAACASAGAVLKPVDDNPIDSVWSDRPPPPTGPVEVYPAELAGRTAEDKLAGIAAALGAAATGADTPADARTVGDAGSGARATGTGADATVLTLSDSIAWLFNIRGRDIPHTPVVQAYAIVRRHGRAELYMHPGKLTAEAASHLSALADIHPPQDFEAALAGLGATGAAVLVDPATAPEKIRAAIAESGGRVVTGADPCSLPKANKTSAELDGARAAHRRDAVAMARFLCWLDREAPHGQLDEIAVVRRLEAFRAESNALRDIAFDTIAGAGPHAAIPHYRVTEASNRPVERDAILLVDSGGQYLDGTTDITRTVARRQPDGRHAPAFHPGAEGMLAVSRPRFPHGHHRRPHRCLRPPCAVAGRPRLRSRHRPRRGRLSVGARGPARLAKSGHTVLDTGMILSNEPGFYMQDHYGIRIENLIAVTEPADIPGGTRPMHGFETLTLAPIDRRLIDVGVLSAGEIDWLDTYHARVLAEIGPGLDADDRSWLEQATAPLPR